ncbi:MAG: GNAT family N-acetyltransferase [Acidobacteria bacterium]|nr:GNAT family N-acetyltransferase [Acidobacteriota bacterium]MBV9625948.1 GNAT family N-acetyltransferase [Acidobacteriota bacterium]
MKTIEHEYGDYVVSTDPARLDHDVIHRFLTNSYWAKGIPRQLVARCIENSLCFGVFRGREQVGFARVISDYATFAYVGDVFILAEHRGRGLGKFLMSCVMNHPELVGLRRWSLVTRDGHGLYRQFGFTSLARPDGYMELHNPGVYEPASGENA